MAHHTLQPILRCAADRLQFRYPFRIAHGERTGTDIVLVKVAVDGYFGLGEATLPPYLPWKVSDVLALLEHIHLTIDLTNARPQWTVSDERLFRCAPAMAAIDMAVWNLAAAAKTTSVEHLLGYTPRPCPHTFTLGISDKIEMAEKMDFARSEGFTLFKLKMDAHHSAIMLEQFKALSDAPFAVDANQGWVPSSATNAFAHFLEKNGCIMIEQPFDRNHHEAHRQLSQWIDIPVIADESIQNQADFELHAECYDGINIKLQKCGGITPALGLIEKAIEANKAILIGCMSESSIGCGSAEALASKAHWADLDGPWLISNNSAIQDRAASL